MALQHRQYRRRDLVIDVVQVGELRARVAQQPLHVVARLARIQEAHRGARLARERTVLVVIDAVDEIRRVGRRLVAFVLHGELHEVPAARRQFVEQVEQIGLGAALAKEVLVADQQTALYRRHTHAGLALYHSTVRAMPSR
jgi:hypothetical protein